MAKYKVRKHFVLFKDGQRIQGETEVELSPEEAKKYAHQIEPIPAIAKTKNKET